jgi:hypothetical protein
MEKLQAKNEEETRIKESFDGISKEIIKGNHLP